MSEPLARVDSAVDGLEASPLSSPKLVKHRRASSTASGILNINDLEAASIELELAPETQKTGWKINTSPSTVEDKDILKKMLTTPPVKKINLHFPLGLEVTARNIKGVTIKDALDAIYKQHKKRADDEIDEPYLAGFEWDKKESWTRLIVHLQKNASQPASKKKKGKAGES